MRVSLAAVLLLSVLATRPVLAGGINLSWDECGVAGHGNKSFACNTNLGSETLVVSFEPNAPMSDFAGVDIALRLKANNGEALFPSWWMMWNNGTCRGPTTPTLSASFGGTSCADLWQGNNAAASAHTTC